MPIPLLEGVTIVEIARSVAARYAGRVLADLGAEVITISPEDDDHEDRDAREQRLSAYLAANKRRAMLDLSDTSLDRICEQADIVIYDRSLENDGPLLDPVALVAKQCVVTIVTPFGMESPYTSLHGDELLFFGLSGIASITPEGAEDRSYERPMHPFGHQAAFVGGVSAAAASLQAWITTRETGRGSLLDVAVVDAVAATPIISQATVFGGHVPPNEDGLPRPRSMLFGAFRCADGYLYMMGRNWDGLAEALERPEWLEGAFSDPEYRLTHMDEIHAVVEDRLGQMACDDAVRRCQAVGVVAFPINSIRQVTEDPQISARGVFQPIVGADGSRGNDFVAPRTPIRIYEGRGPERTVDVLRQPGADTSYARERLLGRVPTTARATTSESHLPLEGVRVADFSWVLAGPQCTKWLGALGAEIVKVESRHRPDSYRMNAPFLDENPESLEGSVSWNMLNYSKKSFTINLGTSEGRGLAQRLVAVSEVAIENYSTGVAERVGLDYQALLKDNPSLVMVSSSGVGRTGPDSGRRAYGKAIHAFSGHTHLTAWPGTPPRGLGGTWTDPTTGMITVLAILAGLIYSRRTGESVHFDLSMAECTISLMADAFLDYFDGSEPAPVGNRDTHDAPHNSFLCADGWIGIACHTETEWQALAALLRQTELARWDRETRLARVEEIDSAIDAWCEQRPLKEALAALHAIGVCAVPVLTFSGVLSDGHFRDRGMITKLSKEGIGTYSAFKIPWISVPEVELNYSVAPHLGEHNGYVRKEILGLSEDDIDALLAVDALT